MLTRTSLNSAFVAKVRAAAREAIHNAAVATLYAGSQATHQQGQAYVKNRRGKLMLRVDYQYDRVPALRFWEGSRKDITGLMTQALEVVL